MSIGILIISHNALGNEILSTASDIFGKLPIETKVMNIKPDSDYDQNLAQAKQYVKELNTDEGVLILSDIFGATPCNIAIKAAEGTKAQVVTGINLPMMVRILNYSQLPLKEIVAKAINAGHNSIFECNED